MKTKATLILPVFFFFSFFTAGSQIIFKRDAALQKALQQVLTDFPNRLENISGRLLQENIESSDYASKVIFPGAETCTVTSYKSQKNKSRSWQAFLPETESFADAKKQYHYIFMQVKNMGILLPGSKKPAVSKGNYDEPKEEKKFAGSLFRITGDDTVYQDVKVEVALQYTITGWQVSVYVYEKKEDDEIRPDGEE